MECIEFFQVFITCFRSLTSSSSSSSTSSVAAVDTDIPPLQDSSSSVGAADTDILPLKERYDVFLSFRGEDTRLAFTSHLHKALLGKKIETYIDDRLVRGDEIAPALLEAIARSTISVIIFSEKYASSTWCLKELVHILGCKKRYGQFVLPIFYLIDPSDLRNKKGTYALALDELEKRFKGSTDEVVNWRDALKEAADMAGFHYSSKTGRTEADFVEEVVQGVLTKLNSQSSGDLKDSPVGIEKKIEKIESLLCLDSPGVCCVGIWGMGGIGKTTLAEAVFHRQMRSSKFEVCCFLANVRENSEKTDGLHHLRKKLVGEILNDKDVNIDTPSLPANILIRLRRTKALIVLDDVNARKQLEYLVGDDDRFCQGSRIIITARDKGLLEQKVDHEKIYNVEGLGSDEALKLFHSHAFGIKSPTTDYTELSREVVDYIKGIPLVLKVMGSSFRRCKSKQEWEDQWKKVKEFPDEEINQVLRISYDGLGKHEKEMFLDIACFHKGRRKNYVKECLDGCDFHGEAGINDLIDRSLILISYSRSFWMDKLEVKIEMHDLVQEMGRAIAREQRNRLFIAKDVYQVLTNKEIGGHVQAISFDLNEIKKLHLQLEHANFEKMHQLRFLHVSHFLPSIVSLDLPNSLRFLEWHDYPLKSLPSNFPGQNLVVVDTSSNNVEAQLWNEYQSPMNLKRISLRFCYSLTEVPNLSWSLNIEHIDLRYCQSLVEIPSYFQDLNKLTYLNLGHSYNLKNLAEMPCNLEFLNLPYTAIEELPSSVWSHEKISHLDIRYCKHLKSLPSNSCKLKLSNSFSLEGCESLCEFWELPRNTTVLELSGTTIKELRNTSIESVVGLTSIKLINCKSLVSLPTNIWKLKYLESLDLSGCSNFQHLPEILEAMEHLVFLNLPGTTVKELPPSIESVVGLTSIKLINCKSLVSLPTNIWKLKYLESLDLSGCSNFQHLPEILEAMEHLVFLNLSGTAVKELPPSIGNLVALRKLDLSWIEIKNIPASIKQATQLSHMCLINCESLESLPELPPLLQCLEAEDCTSLKTVSSSSTALAHGWEKYKFSRGLHEKHIFSDCRRLDENARSNIMGDAHLRIMRMATASSKFKEDKIEEKIEQASYDSDYFHDESEKEFFGKRSSVAIRCWGYEIPKWFSHQSEGSSIKIELPHDWFSTDFFGFALSFVVGFAAQKIGCKYNFKTSNGESHEVNHPLFYDSRINELTFVYEDSHEVFVWWYNNVFEEVIEEGRSPTAFYNHFTEVNVDFHLLNYHREPFPVGDEVEVEKCGICLLYGKDAEMMKQRALYAQDAEIQIFS